MIAGGDEKVAGPNQPEQQPNMDDPPVEGSVGEHDGARTTTPVDKILAEIPLVSE